MARVLLVEDDGPLRRGYRRYFERSFVVDEASDVASARRLLEARRYQRALIDVMLPDGDGLDLLAWMRSAGHRCPTLVVTGAFDGRLSQRGAALGAPVVPKPVPEATLRALAAPHKGRSPASIARDFAAAHGLTPRQTDLLEAVARGARPSGLPVALGVAQGTAKRFTQQILAKTGARSLDDLLTEILVAADSASDT